MKKDAAGKDVGVGAGPVPSSSKGEDVTVATLTQLSKDVEKLKLAVSELAQVVLSQPRNAPAVGAVGRQGVGVSQGPLPFDAEQLKPFLGIAEKVASSIIKLASAPSSSPRSKKIEAKWEEYQEKWIDNEIRRMHRGGLDSV